MIGFELDHCLVKYYNASLIKHLIKGHLKELYEEFDSYKKIEGVLDFDYDNYSKYYMNHAVWDLETGNILKLAHGKKIVKAVHGHR